MVKVKENYRLSESFWQEITRNEREHIVTGTQIHYSLCPILLPPKVAAMELKLSAFSIKYNHLRLASLRSQKKIKLNM
jgi:hypothetical protein